MIGAILVMVIMPVLLGALLEGLFKVIDGFIRWARRHRLC